MGHKTADTTEFASRVLVVEDDRLLRSQAVLVLRAAGYRTLEAPDGEAALDLLESKSADLVLLDIRMPGIDGFETCRRIRARHSKESLPVIVTTGLDDIAAVDTAFEAGATDYVVKPLNWEVLKHRLRFVLNARNMAEDLLATRDRRKGLMQAIQDTVLHLDAEGRITEARCPVEGGAAPGSVFPVGRLLRESLPPEVRRDAQRAVIAARENKGQASFDFEITDGADARSYEVRLAKAGRGEIVALIRDLTDWRMAQAEIHRLAYFDRLTGLLNRERLQQLVEIKLRSMATQARLALVHLEIEGLGNTRGLLGESLTNDLLRRFGQRLLALPGASQDPDAATPCLIGRIGDAAFAVAQQIPNRDHSVVDFADGLLNTVSRSYALGDYEVGLRVRLGVEVLSTPVGGDGAELFDRAAMAAAESRDGPAYYADRFGQRRRERAGLIRDLQSAVSNGDLHLEYQPKVDAVGRELLGVEALARWHHPTRGPISPGTFIPLAEENDLIVPIGQFVLETACSQGDRWARQQGRVVPIAVNFSGRQFVKKDLLQSVLRTLARHNIGEGGIEVELTETIAMEQCGGIQTVLQAFCDIGIRTAIDDFGTGYSSLDNLRRFRFHTLKIDRSFVTDLDRNPSAHSIVRGIIGMGHALGMQVVAEGVEEDHQLEYLREHRCDVIQGYLTGRPMAPEAIEPMLYPSAVGPSLQGSLCAGFDR